MMLQLLCNVGVTIGVRGIHRAPCICSRNEGPAVVRQLDNPDNTTSQLSRKASDRMVTSQQKAGVGLSIAISSRTGLIGLKARDEACATGSTSALYVDGFHARRTLAPGLLSSHHFTRRILQFL